MPPIERMKFHAHFKLTTVEISVVVILNFFIGEISSVFFGRLNIDFNSIRLHKSKSVKHFQCNVSH